MKIPVFYTEAMVADGRTSPSAKKPKAVVEAWEEEFPGQIEVRRPALATIEKLSLAHDREFVENVLSLREHNGFGTRSKEVARSLPYTTGAMVTATIEACLNQRVACAPVSGFHHAGWDTASGFCTFNGLVVAAQVARLTSHAQRVGILDCDQHYGNGTDEIIRKLDLGRWILHWTAGGEGFGHRTEHAQDFLDELPEVLTRMKKAGCEVALYQAGADPHVDDPLGGFLTDEQLQERDRIVFSTCRELRLPVAWDLAGGYREPISKVVGAHVRTMEECIRVFG